MRPAKAGIEIVDPVEMIALGAEAERFEGVGQHILRAIVTGVHGGLRGSGPGRGR
jgi:hypothetical protein